MNTSYYIAHYLVKRGIHHVFGIIGSAMYTLFTALGETDGIDYICPLHEQAAGFAADGYSRVTNTIGVAIGTVGPGATNLITACAGSFLDSIPVIYFIGTNSLPASKGDLPLRSYLFQEIDTEKLFKPITKATILVNEPNAIRDILDEAFLTAITGRPGPVAILLPENIMYADTNVALPDGLMEFSEKKKDYSQSEIHDCIHGLMNAQRPLLLYGAGIHSGKCEKKAIDFAEKIHCPIALSYPARDLIAENHPLNVGSIGIFGSRGGNYTMQSADFILCIGCRLDPFIIGNSNNFAQDAFITVVDIDANELSKFKTKGPAVNSLINLDADSFFSLASVFVDSYTKEHNREEWICKIKNWKKKYPMCKKEYWTESSVNPYCFVSVLSTVLKPNDLIFTDSGLSAVWIGQAFEFKNGQRWLSQFSFSSMGYSLPASIGASIATEGRIICISGDGGLQMNIQELASLSYHNTNVKVIIICNDGYGLIQKTQDDFNKGHFATDRENHVPIPNSDAIAKAYGIKTIEIVDNNSLFESLSAMLEYPGPCFCSVRIPITKRITPRVRGGNLSNMYPFLSDSEVKGDLSL